MQASLTPLVFPEDLRNDENKFRTVTFSALASPNANKNKDKSIMQSTIEQVKEYANKLGTESNLVSYLTNDNMTLQSQVSLPYPNNISDSQEHSWNRENSFMKTALSNVGGLLTSGLGTLASSFAAGKGLKSVASKVTGNISFDTGLGQFTNYAGIRKPLIDPGLFQNYTGSNPRTFTMVYTFIPNNSKEAQKIKEIILWFKMYSSPTLVPNSAVMLSPYCFNLDFGSNPYISEMFNMKCAVITNIQVDYGSDGNMQLFQDGFPKQINLTMTFSEAELTYANAYGAQEQTVSNESGSDINSNPSSATPSQPKNIDDLKNLAENFNF